MNKQSWKKKKMGKLCQFNTALACSFGSLVMGLLNVWPSYTLSIYTSQNSTVLSAPMSELESSLVGSLPSLGAMVGTAVAGVIIDSIGRQKGGVVLSLPFVLSWSIIGLTSSSVVILICRFVSGIAGGAFLVFAPIFISEVAEDSIRGTLAAGPISFYFIGTLISYLMGWFLNYHAVIWGNLVFSVTCTTLCLTVVESPLYFLRKNREEDAKIAIAKYRGVTKVSKLVLEELSKLKEQITPAVELISWAIIGQTSSSIIILISRFISGIAGGAFLVFAPMFISEVAEDSIRGTLASGPVSFYCIGTLISYLMGWFLNYRTIIWGNLLFSVMCTALCWTAVESPLYLLRQNREEDAKAAIAKYRGTTKASKLVLEELSRLKAQITPAVELVLINDEGASQEQKSLEAEKDKPEAEKEKSEAEKGFEAEKEKLTAEEDITEEQPRMSAIKLLFVSPSSSRALVVVATALTLQVLMGMVPVQVYAKDLFAQAAPKLSSHFCSVLFAIVLVGGCLVVTLVADKAGRRILVIGSSAMVALCMTTLAFLLQTEVAPAWVSAVVILIYCFMFSCGAGTVPYVLLAEVFIPEVQGVASLLLVEWVWFLNFGIIAIFPHMKKLIGIHGVFYFFAAVGVTNAVLSFLNVPETKGLSNEKIQEAFLKRRK